MRLIAPFIGDMLFSRSTSCAAPHEPGFLARSACDRRKSFKRCRRIATSKPKRRHAGNSKTRKHKTPAATRGCHPNHRKRHSPDQKAKLRGHLDRCNVATANEETLPPAINFVIARQKAKPQHPHCQTSDRDRQRHRGVCRRCISRAGGP